MQFTEVTNFSKVSCEIFRILGEFERFLQFVKCTVIMACARNLPNWSTLRILPKIAFMRKF